MLVKKTILKFLIGLEGSNKVVSINIYSGVWHYLVFFTY